MFRLDIVRENRWLELPHGVKVEVRPRTTALDAATAAEAAQRTAAEQREADAQAAAGQPLDPAGFNAANEAVVNGLFFQNQTEALARFGIIRWEGVAGADGHPLPVTPEAIRAFAAHPDLAGGFRAKYDAGIESAAVEGNASTPTSAGDTAEAPSTAEAAQPDQEPTPQEMVEDRLAVPDAEPVPQS